VIKSPYLEELREAVRQDALAKGRAEGEAEGQLKLARATLLNQGRQRFGKAATRKQRAEPEALTDLPRLERILNRILVAESWADLLTTP
jgi:hypothetical protein